MSSANFNPDYGRNFRYPIHNPTNHYNLRNNPSSPHDNTAETPTNDVTQSPLDDSLQRSLSPSSNSFSSDSSVRKGTIVKTPIVPNRVRAESAETSAMQSLHNLSGNISGNIGSFLSSTTFGLLTVSKRIYTTGKELVENLKQKITPPGSPNAAANESSSTDPSRAATPINYNGAFSDVSTDEATPVSSLNENVNPEAVITQTTVNQEVTTVTTAAVTTVVTVIDNTQLLKNLLTLVRTEFFSKVDRLSEDAEPTHTEEILREILRRMIVTKQANLEAKQKQFSTAALMGNAVAAFKEATNLHPMSKKLPSCMAREAKTLAKLSCQDAASHILERSQVNKTLVQKDFV